MIRRNGGVCMDRACFLTFGKEILGGGGVRQEHLTARERTRRAEQMDESSRI